jgi:hypothetical protein
MGGGDDSFVVDLPIDLFVDGESQISGSHLNVTMNVGQWWQPDILHLHRARHDHGPSCCTGAVVCQWRSIFSVEPVAPRP